MASGKQHFKNNVKLSVVLISTYYVICAYFFNIYYDDIYLLIVTGFMLGILITPDIDIPGKTYTEFCIETICKKIFPGALGITSGWILKNIYFILTYPIGYFFPHRSFYTHFPIISTVVKVCYFFIIYCIITLSIPSFSWSFSLLNILIPWIILDIQHFIDDGCMYIGIDGNKQYLLGEKFYLEVRKRNSSAKHLSKNQRH